MASWKDRKTKSYIGGKMDNSGVGQVGVATKTGEIAAEIDMLHTLVARLKNDVATVQDRLSGVVANLPPATPSEDARQQGVSALGEDLRATNYIILNQINVLESLMDRLQL
jgi:hypothetical protein